MTEAILTGAQARAIREHLGMTLDAFGRSLGFEGAYVKQHMSALERGKYPIDYKVGHLMMAMALGYKPGFKASAVIGEMRKKAKADAKSN